MRSVVAARPRRYAAMAWQAWLLTAICLTPTMAAAQDPETPPPPPRQPAQVAVPRAETRGEVRAPRGESRAPENRAPERQRAERPVRAPQVQSDDTPSRREVVTTERPAPAAATADASPRDEEQRGASRRGAVRRPPSSDGSTRTADRAVPRAEAPRPESRTRIVTRRGNNYPYYPGYSRYYDPWGYGAFGLGYYYSPWSWLPYGYGGYGAYGYSGYGGYGGNASYYPQFGGAFGFDVGNVKIKVKQRDAEVWVDGYYAGTVDDFDGMFQALKLDSGAYRIEVKKAGYETLAFDVRVQPERTITFRGDLKPIP